MITGRRAAFLISLFLSLQVQASAPVLATASSDTASSAGSEDVTTAVRNLIGGYGDKQQVGKGDC